LPRDTANGCAGRSTRYLFRARRTIAGWRRRCRAWKRYETPQDPAAVLRALRTCREAMLGFSRHLRPFGAGYNAMESVIAAIDACATYLTGNRGYFVEPGHGSNESEVRAYREKMERERGERPWVE
jgi:hypothetical protein